jgi:hypothetical protein
MKPRYRVSNSEAGQAAVEYILILAITVIIILSILWQFSTAFRVYAEAFFDGYIACLLETGELPGTTICDSDIKSFDLNDGQKLIAGNLSPGNGGESGSSADSSKREAGSRGQSDRGKKAESDQAKNTSEESAGSGGEAVAGSGGGGSASVGRVGRFESRRRSTAVGQFKGSSAEAAIAGADSAFGPVPVGSAGNVIDPSRRRALRRDYGVMTLGSDENEEDGRPPVAPVTKKASNGQELKPRVAKEILRKPAAKTDENKESGFTFGNFLKFLLIAIILIAIVVFFGGQLLQISKSREK